MKSLRELIKKNQKIVIGICVLFVLFAVYNTFFKSQESAANLGGEQRDIVSTEVGREIISTLNKLKAISIDTNVFDDVLFQNLFDFSKALPTQPVGKKNPFQDELPGTVQETITQEQVTETTDVSDTTDQQDAEI